MRVTVNELRTATLLLLKHLEAHGQQEFEIEEDFYWSVAEDVRYDSYSEPKELTLGQLSDDWSELQAMLGGRREPIGRGLVWLAAVLRRVGETAVG